jgi:AcrR family transcriptional regulator
MVDLSEFTRPPLRADARRNFERLLEVAREVFSVEGINASLDEIARKAGVGNATLYRHFPTRHALLIAVCVTEVEELCRMGEALTSSADAAEALAEWLRSFLSHIRTKRGLADALMTGNPQDSAVLAACHAWIHGVGNELLARAKAQGAVREGIAFADLFKLLGAIGVATEAERASDASRMLDLVLHGALNVKP